MYGTRYGVSLLLAALGLVACASPTGYEGGAPQPGVLQLLGYGGTFSGGDTTIRWQPEPVNLALVPPAALVLPDTVRAGESFEVTTTTIGLDGCWTASDQSVRVLDAVIEIEPRDVHSGAHICTAVLQYLEHKSPLTIQHPGVWIVRMRGRRLRLDQPAWEQAVIAEKTIVAR